MVFKFLGPFVHMIGNMVEKMIYYVVLVFHTFPLHLIFKIIRRALFIRLMLVMVLSYGVFRQCILFPHEPFCKI